MRSCNFANCRYGRLYQYQWGCILSGKFGDPRVCLFSIYLGAATLAAVKLFAICVLDTANRVLAALVGCAGTT